MVRYKYNNRPAWLHVQMKHTYFLLGFMLGFFLEKDLVSSVGSRLSYLINV